MRMLMYFSYAPVVENFVSTTGISNLQNEGNLHNNVSDFPNYINT